MCAAAAADNNKSLRGDLEILNKLLTSVNENSSLILHPKYTSREVISVKVGL